MKEGFLLYYPESENKVFERAHTFNIHPKVHIQPQVIESSIVIGSSFSLQYIL